MIQQTVTARPRPESDALVVFGVTGDLAHTQIFPALYELVRRDGLGLAVPIIGVARSAWTTDQLRDRVRDSVAHRGKLDAGAFDKLASLLRYVPGDYTDPATFTALKHALGAARRPLFYLA